jgi:hypothetical protein
MVVAILKEKYKTMKEALPLGILRKTKNNVFDVLLLLKGKPVVQSKIL